MFIPQLTPKEGSNGQKEEDLQKEIRLPRVRGHGHDHGGRATAHGAAAATDPWHMTPPDTDITAVNTTTSAFLTANCSTVLTCSPGDATLTGKTTSSSPTGASATLVNSVHCTFANCTSSGHGDYTAYVKNGHLVGKVYTPGSNPPTTGFQGTFHVTPPVTISYT